MLLDDFDPAAFLAEHWQKKPLLIRQGFRGWTNPIEPDELAGLACEEHVESRLVTQTRAVAEAAWRAEHGPLSESRFGELGKLPWTLLVQAVDTHVPEVAALLEAFRFIPNWRIDDVMVSYASDGGGVGPHFDHYDVFLVQGLGRRRWQLGGLCDEATPLLPHDELRLLADFRVEQEWVLEPGDILYVPPRVAHNGVALGDDCMTYSIGFRAPARSELIADYCDHVLAGLQDDDRYTDPHLAMQDNPGEIAAEALDRLHAMIAEALLDRAAFARWFGEYSSTRKYPELDWQPDAPVGLEEMRGYLASGQPLFRNPASRFAFVREAGQLALFVDGESFSCGPGSAAFAERLCAQPRMDLDPRLVASDEAVALIAALYNQGSVAFEG